MFYGVNFIYVYVLLRWLLTHLGSHSRAPHAIIILVLFLVLLGRFGWRSRGTPEAFDIHDHFNGKRALELWPDITRQIHFNKGVDPEVLNLIVFSFVPRRQS